MDKIRLLTLILLISFLCSGSLAIAADTVGEAADMIARSIDGKSIDDLLNSKNISEVMTGMKYMETVKLLRHSYLNELKAKDISDPIALFKNSKSVGAAADILSRAINGKSIDDLLNSSDIIDVLVGFNYLNRVNTLSKETIKADQGELVRIAEFNGEITKKYIWLWHDFNTGIATPITIDN